MLRRHSGLRKRLCISITSFSFPANVVYLDPDRWQMAGPGRGSELELFSHSCGCSMAHTTSCHKGLPPPSFSCDQMAQPAPMADG